MEDWKRWRGSNERRKPLKKTLTPALSRRMGRGSKVICEFQSNIQSHLRKINFRLIHVVEIVGEQGLHDGAERLSDFAVVKTGVAGGFDVLIAGVAAFFDDGAGERHRALGLAV